ncbi:MAG: serine O-acetyltransferase [Anaerolineae bacterium]
MNRIKEDIQTVFAKDPAARTMWEVFFLYPGLHALWIHRLAHFLWRHEFLFLGRLVSHVNRWLTGVEIHPGACIGRRFFIDHGMGVVIGETSEIGDDVLMYQGVVLGGTSTEKTKRHPTIGNGVVIGAGATILGPIVVGDNARVGAGSVVIKPVPAGATIVGVPGRLAGPKRSEKPGADLEHGRLPDPVVRTLSKALSQQSRLEERVQELERTLAQIPPLALHMHERNLSPAREDDIRQALREVIDPEVGTNVVDLGLIREITLNGRGVKVRMVLTRRECPQAGHLVEEVRRKVRSVMCDEPVEVILADEVWSWNDAALDLLWGDGI